MGFIDKFRVKFYLLVYYFLTSLTFCYIYFQKIGVHSDFYSPDSSSGIISVLNFEAIKVMQYRLLVPFLYKLLSLFLPIPEKAVYFVLLVILCFMVIYVFYRLLNEYFEDRKINALLAPVIIYPMAWNYIILNGQSFYVDFSNLIFVLLGYYFIIKKMDFALLATIFIGSLNHDSIGFLIPMYLLFNYKKIFTGRIILISILLTLITVGVKTVLSEVFINNAGASFRWNHIRNFYLVNYLPVTHTIRNIFLIFGGLHLIILASIKNPVWKKVSGPRIMINMTFILYVIIIFFIHSIEEIRNYITAIPFIIIPFLIYLSSLNSSLLVLKEKTE
jgi:hypothetical protein